MGAPLPVVAIMGAGQRWPTTTAPRQMNVTMRSSKEEIATAAVELIDTQAEQISQLQQRQAILWALVALLAIWQVL